MEIVKLLIENPVSGVAVTISIASFLFYCGKVYTNLKHMQDSMVTKKDLELAIANFSAKMHETFVKKSDMVSQ